MRPCWLVLILSAYSILSESFSAAHRAPTCPLAASAHLRVVQAQPAASSAAHVSRSLNLSLRHQHPCGKQAAGRWGRGQSRGQQQNYTAMRLHTALPQSGCSSDVAGVWQGCSRGAPPPPPPPPALKPCAPPPTPPLSLPCHVLYICPPTPVPPAPAVLRACHAVRHVAESQRL